MFDSMLQEVNGMFPEKALLTLPEVAQFLGCADSVIYNWTRRADPTKRPPGIMVGKALRFPKGPLMQWLIKEQGISEVTL